MRIQTFDGHNIEEVLRRTRDIVNGKINIVDNIFCDIYSGTTPATPDTVFTIAHNLGKTPEAYFCNINSAGIVYDYLRSSWTSTQLTLKCNVASATITLVIF